MASSPHWPLPPHGRQPSYTDAHLISPGLQYTMPGYPSPTSPLHGFPPDPDSVPIFQTEHPSSYSDALLILPELWHHILGHMAPSTPLWHISYCEWPYLRLWGRNFQEDEGGSDNVATFKFSWLRNIQNFWTLSSFSFFSMVTLAPNPALIPFLYKR